MKLKGLTLDTQLSTCQVGKYMGISGRTVSRLCVDYGLKHFRAGKMGNRRIIVRNLIAFMVRHGVPLDDELQALANEETKNKTVPTS